MLNAPDKITRVFFYCSFIILFLILSYFILGEIFMPSENHQKSFQCELYSEPWTYTDVNGNSTPISLPHDFHTPAGEPVSISTVLPSHISDDAALCFRSGRQDMNIYIDGLKITSYSTKETRLFGSSSPAVYLFFKLKPSYAGKTLRLEAVTTSSYSGMFYAVNYGNTAGIWAHLIKEGISELIIALIMLIAGLTSFIFSISYMRSMQESTTLLHIGCASVLAAIWVFTNSTLRQLLFPNVSIASDIPFLVIMLIPVPLAMYMDNMQNDRYHKLYLTLMALSLTNLIVSTILHVSGIMEYNRSAIGMEIMVILLVILILYTLIMDLRSQHIKEYKLSAIGIFLAMTAGAIQLALYMMRVFSFNGMMMCIALLFIMITSAINAFQDVGKKEIERREAVMASQSKAQFLANMSHEIRTPINAVLGMNEMILRESTEANVREYATDLQHAGQSLLSLINDILDYSKLESNNVEIINVDYELASLINDSYNMISMRAKEKKLTLQVEKDGYLPCRLNGDEIRLRQIILNLLTNAVKYTKEGTVTLRIGGDRLSETDFKLRVSVEDTGIGIKEEDLAVIFDSFQRVEQTRNRTIEGTGLGLSITQHLIELMNGTLSVTSKYGQGSTFTFEVMQTIINADSLNDVHIQYTQHASLNEVYEENFTAPDAKILVVDDVVVNLKVVQGLLKTSKIRIFTATSGQECLDYVVKEHFDLIFLDHMMPKMDGIETFKQMKTLENNQNTDTPVIMLTANALSGSKEEYLSIGFTDYLSKPIQSSSLEEVLLTYLPKRLIVMKNNSPFVINENESLIDQLNKFLDADAGLDYYSGSEEFYKEILIAYVEDGDVEKLNSLYEAEDWHNYQVSIHSVKSSSIYIGATLLSDETKKLEEAAKELKIDYIKEHHSSVMHMYQEIIDRLDQILHVTNPGEDS